MAFYSQGDVVLVKFPFTDLSNFKIRPALVVSNSIINRSEDVIVVMLTSQRVPAEFCEIIDNSHVNVPFKELSTMNVNCKKIAVLDRRIIHRKITECTNTVKFRSILTKIKSNFDYDDV